MATTISNLVAYSWQLELGGPASAGIFGKLPGNIASGSPKYLSEWVTQVASTGQLQDVYNLTPSISVVGTNGGSVTLKLDTNGNGKFDYTDANANGKYDAGEDILEEVQIYYNGIDVTQSGKQIQGYAHYDLTSKTWVDGAGNSAAIVPQPPVVTNPTNPYDPYNPYNPNVYDPYNQYNQYSQYGAPPAGLEPADGATMAAAVATPVAAATLLYSIPAGLLLLYTAAVLYAANLSLPATATEPLCAWRDQWVEAL